MINWKLRLRNKTTLAALITTVLAAVYQVCGIFGIVPPVSQDQVAQMAALALNILVALGVIIDPTTKGIGDSACAMGYTEPGGDVDIDGCETPAEANAGRDGKGDDNDKPTAPAEGV